MIMERLMAQNIKKDLIYYGVYSTSDDMWNGSDVLCAARKRFFETGVKQKKRSTIKLDSITYNYSYTLENGTLLKYRKTKGGVIIEHVTETPDGYCVEQFNDRHQAVKRVYYQRQHIWLRTEYVSDGVVTLMMAPGESENQPSIVCKSQNRTEILYPFDVVLDKEYTQRLNIMTSEPRVFCMTNCGSLYFCTEEELRLRREALDKLMQAEQPPTQPPDKSQSAFVVDVSLLQKQEHGCFDLRDSQEVRLSDAQQEIPPATAADSDTAIEQAEDSLEVPTEAEEVPPATAADSDTAMEQDESFFEKVAAIAAKALQEEKASAQETPLAAQTAAVQDVLTVAEEKPAAEEAAVSVESDLYRVKEEKVSEQTGTCLFVGECPYEMLEKRVIPTEEKSYYYFGETADGQRNGYGRTVTANGMTVYEGHYVQDQRDGFGVNYYESGQLCYAGRWKQNRREGFGTAFSAANGSVLAGQWQEDHAVGVMAHFDEEGQLLYAGGTRNGQRNGAGLTYNRQNGTYFVGKYEDGVFLETGTQFDRNGNLLYSGGYRNSVRCGEGTAYTPEGKVLYQGQWLNDRYHGEGTLYREDGSHISGHFRNGEICGQGTLTGADGRVIYSGSFMDDRYNGTGRYYYVDGRYIEGRFRQGEPSGIMNEYNAAKKLVYCGEWSGGYRSGRGIVYENGEKRYEGEFRQSLYHGEGKLYQNGEVVYIGSFKEGRRDGFGVSYHHQQMCYKGEWQNDAYNGCGILYENGEAKYIGQFRNGKRDGRINEIAGHQVFRKSLFALDERIYTCEYGADNALVYYGSMSGEDRSGMGCSFGDHTEKQFEGIFRQNKPEKPMRVILKELYELPPCAALSSTEYELYRLTPEYIIEKSITVHGVNAVYSGRMKNGLPDGDGTILYSDHRYTGFFVNGQPEHEGVLYLHSGEERRGQFSAKPFEGCQTLVLSDVTYYYRPIGS